LRLTFRLDGFLDLDLEAVRDAEGCAWLGALGDHQK